MKTSTIWYIIIGVVVLYLIYKAYNNYQISGSIFSSESPLGTGASGSRYNTRSIFGGVGTGFTAASSCIDSGCRYDYNLNKCICAKSTSSYYGR